MAANIICMSFIDLDNNGAKMPPDNIPTVFIRLHVPKAAGVIFKVL